MVSTADLVELQELLNSTLGDPHHILGMHEVLVKGKEKLVVRVFIPQAKTITVVDAENQDKEYPLDKIHVDGFFEGIIGTRKKWFRYILKIEGYNGDKWEMYDPYSFVPTISEFDIYLFSEGTNYEIYEKMGAHVTTVDGIEGVSFTLWAPNAKRVSVIGEFNLWDGRRNMMRMLQHSGVWEIFIPGIKVMDRYRFEIKTVSGQLIQKTDPYGNYMDLRPSTSSIVYDLNTYKWNDEKWIENKKYNKPLNGPINIYEVHLGSWKQIEDGDIDDGTRFFNYVEIADQLIPYVKNMGYTHIELLPITEYPYDGSWGYQVSGYFAPTSRYGSPSDFMYFVDECHKNGIGVILDWVPAHFPKDSHGLAKFDGSSVYEHEDPRRGEQPEWGTLIFNYGRNEVKNFLITSALFWIEKFHIDGLRVDAIASILYLDYGREQGMWLPNKYGGRENIDAVEFLKHMNSIVFKRNPETLMIAEDSTSWEGVTKTVEENGLGFNLKWNMGWMNDFLSYMGRETIHRKHHQNDLTFAMMYNSTENFCLVLSHDEVVHGKKSMLDKMPGDLWQKFANLRVAYGFMYAHSGKKLLFMGGEFGQFIEWNEKRSLDWFLLEYEHHKQMLHYTRDLNKLYLENKALWAHDFSHDGFEWIQCDDNERSLLSFIRKGDLKEETLIAICNFTPTPILDYRMGVPFDANYIEIFNSDNSEYGGSGILNTEIMISEKIEWDNRENSIAIKLPPLGFIILKTI